MGRKRITNPAAKAPSLVREVGVEANPNGNREERRAAEKYAKKVKRDKKGKK